MSIEGVTVAGTEIVISRELNDKLFKKKYGDYWLSMGNADIIVCLDKRETEELKLETIANEFKTHVQKFRKNAGIAIEDRITIY